MPGGYWFSTCRSPFRLVGRLPGGVHRVVTRRPRGVSRSPNWVETGGRNQVTALDAPCRIFFCFELALPVGATCPFFTPPKTCPLAGGRLRAQPRGGERPTPQACTEANGCARPFRGFLGAPIEAAAMAAPPAPVWQHMARRTTTHSQRLANVANVITRAALYARCASLPPLRTLAIRSPTRHHCGVERPPPLPLTLPHRLDRCPRRQTYRSRPRSERRTTTRFPTRRGCATTRTESICW